MSVKYLYLTEIEIHDAIKQIIKIHTKHFGSEKQLFEFFIEKDGEGNEKATLQLTNKICNLSGYKMKDLRVRYPECSDDEIQNMYSEARDFLQSKLNQMLKDKTFWNF